MENEYIEYPKHKSINLGRIIKFWRNKSLRGDIKDKGGSFDINLYLRYLDVLNSK